MILFFSLLFCLLTIDILLNFCVFLYFTNGLNSWKPLNELLRMYKTHVSLALNKMKIAIFIKMNHFMSVLAKHIRKIIILIGFIFKDSYNLIDFATITKAPLNWRRSKKNKKKLFHLHWILLSVWWNEN